MTRNEAKLALGLDQKVTHVTFGKGMFLHLDNDLIVRNEKGEKRGLKQEFGWSIYKEPSIPDAENPLYLFTGTATTLLVQIAQRKIDAEYFAIRTLCDRGLDTNGNWVGFEKAKKALEAEQTPNPSKE